METVNKRQHYFLVIKTLWKKLWETFGNKRRRFQETRNSNKKFLVVASVETGLYIIKNA